MIHNIDDLQSQVMALRLEVEALVSRIEAASRASWAALSHYRRCRILIDRFIGKARGRQQSAWFWSVKLGRLRPRSRALISDCETLMRRLGPTSQLRRIREDLNEVSRLLAEWSTKSCRMDRKGGDQ